MVCSAVMIISQQKMPVKKQLSNLALMRFHLMP